MKGRKKGQEERKKRKKGEKVEKEEWRRKSEKGKWSVFSIRQGQREEEKDKVHL